MYSKLIINTSNISNINNSNIDLTREGGTRAVDGGFGYLRRPKWWFGISLMALGELTNFVAYIFAPAILVTPLGVFSIVCTATLSPYFLKERLNSVGKLGCVLVLVGCIIVTLCGPKDREVSTLEELKEQLLNPGFLIYAGIVVGVSIILMALVPKFGHKYVMFYISICSSFGSLSVMFCKGVGLAIKQSINGQNAFSSWITWVCVVSLVVCLLIETVYMQRALDLFNSSVFMSVNYVMFTSLVIVASAILYTEFADLGWKNIILTILGFIVNIVALYLLHLDKVNEYPPQGQEQDLSPDPNPETPLMLKNNIISNEKICTRSSPLSNIGLSPKLFRENKVSESLLNYINKDCGRESQSLHHLEEKLSIQSSSNCNEACSCSSKSNSSEDIVTCIPLDNQLKDDVSRTTIQRNIEVPLVTDLQSVSLRRKLSSPSRKRVEKDQKETEASSRPSSDFSDADEVTKLV
ncbi:Magnesium transporter NIPA2 [Armadillidium vulgare]|nr:Magnesium transporter NIPA2 [Armadillidium vulgare]